MKIQLITFLLSLSIIPANAAEGLNKGAMRASCEQATKKFERIELETGHKTDKATNFSDLCEDIKKSASYWACMNEQADQNIELNVAHSKCATS